MNRPDPHPFERLTPDFIGAAVESVGYVTDGRLLALNSYENRVYQVGVEGPDGAIATPMVAKFYRPGRWNRAAIEEEHAFALELAATEIPVVAPLSYHGRTLHHHQEFWFAVYPRQGGRWPELDKADDRLRLGRFLGRIHAVGARSKFRHRQQLNLHTWASESRRFLLQHDWIPEHLGAAYESTSAQLLQRMQTQWHELADLPQLRLHGDCHLGNVLWTEQGPHFVDLDDCMTGPAMQDLWMLLSGSRAEQAQQLDELLEGYTQFANFDYRELALIETLRTLRVMHYAAWLARRWEDPAFPRAFPWFGDNKFWERHVLDLREQLAALDEQPLELAG
jgi:Ser/Thr protein kinase RdoA (MazF antagonist)